VDPAGGIVEELRTEHDSLLSLVRGLDAADLQRGSYATEWTIAQVLSHLGSGAEINLSNLRAALYGTDRIPHDAYPQLWERWDTLPAGEKAAGFERWHGELVACFEDVDPDLLDDLEVATAMGTLSGRAVLGMRLREACIHAWDVAVAIDDGAVIRSGAAGILADQAPEMMERLADPSAAVALDHEAVSIVGSDPDRTFVLRLEDPVILRPDESVSGSAVLRLPTESLVRLVYGRLDDDHLNGSIVQEPDGLLDRLRAVFAGL
jgi:uncharacterized protein (TIGR03083 family)